MEGTIFYTMLLTGTVGFIGGFITGIVVKAPIEKKLVDAAANLRKAQRAYMLDRGNESLGKKVGKAAERLDYELGKWGK